ncbi:MAG: energy transducer TonB [Elusimicrobiaceae bacterium]|nr:energy transducer TonB [Elusimicrobiaceae bacterium]
MPLSLLYSGLLHILVFSLLFFCMQGQSQNKKKQATYTIDFIGSSATPMRYGTWQEQKPAPALQAVEAAPAEQPKAEVKEETQIKTAKPKETKKPAYNSEAQITKEKQKTTAKPQELSGEEKVVLSKPSILKDVQTSSIDVSDQNLESVPGERAVQASFTNFPYPWYITQVRNNLWTAWQKLMPKKTLGLSVLVSFNIDKNGAVYGVQIDKSSKNDDFDYKGKVAVLNSAPYPPLPQDYGKEILTVSVEFKNEE